MSGVLERLPPPFPSVDLKSYVGATATRDAVTRAFDNFFHVYGAIFGTISDFKNYLPFFNGRSKELTGGGLSDSGAPTNSVITGENEADTRSHVKDGKVPKKSGVTPGKENGNRLRILETDWLPLIMALVVDIALIILCWWKNTNMSLFDRSPSRRKPRMNIRDLLAELSKLTQELPLPHVFRSLGQMGGVGFLYHPQVQCQ